MSTILAYTSPAFGYLFPMTPLLLDSGTASMTRTCAPSAGGVAQPIKPRAISLARRSLARAIVVAGSVAAAGMSFCLATGAVP